jgi:hypothetical protein
MKRLPKTSLQILVLSLVAACAPKPKAPSPEVPASSTQASSDCYEAQGHCLVSIVELIANPAKFDGKKVWVNGYVHIGFENSGIYLHEDDYLHVLPRNGLWVNLADGVDPDKCQDYYASVMGTFKSGPGGHLGGWSGAIENATMCERLPHAREKRR